MRHTLKESILEGPVHSYACRLRAAVHFAHLDVAVCDTRRRRPPLEQATASQWGAEGWVMFALRDERTNSRWKAATVAGFGVQPLRANARG